MIRDRHHEEEIVRAWMSGLVRATREEAAADPLPSVAALKRRAELALRLDRRRRLSRRAIRPIVLFERAAWGLAAAASAAALWGKEEVWSSWAALVDPATTIAMGLMATMILIVAGVALTGRLRDG